MRRECGAVLAAMLLAASILAWGQTVDEQLPFSSPDGRPVQWSQWLQTNGPAAVVFWSSWAPGSAALVESLSDLAEACSSRGLALVLVAVQEPLENASKVLSGHDEQWFHDRHGASLKQYRVIRIPGIVVIDRAGAVVDRLDPTPQAVRQWRAR